MTEPMKQTLEILNKLAKKGIIDGYAIGGAVAAIFHTEPAETADLDIFVTFPKSELIVDLTKMTRELEAMGYQQWEKEGIIVEGIPVQFLPAESGLLKEAYEKASKENIEGTQTRIMTLEYLCAIMLETGRPKDKIRLGACWGHKNLNMENFQKICSRHGLGKKLEKFQTLYIEGIQ